jgi:hypothetical protein
MRADQIRNRTVGCKMTDSEYERLSTVVEIEGMTLSEWYREAGGQSFKAVLIFQGGRSVAVFRRVGEFGAFVNLSAIQSKHSIRINRCSS